MTTSNKSNPDICRNHDPLQDIWKEGAHPLELFFKPGAIAVIGATEKPGAVGQTILKNLIQNPFGGTVYPVNPNRKSVLGIKAYPSVKDLPEKMDLAVIVTPAKTVPGIIKECREAGIHAAIIISAGFKEIGPEGIQLEKEILEEARAAKMRIIGPNCLGVMNPFSGLNATFAGAMARPGKVAFLSQSGALCTAVLDWSLREQVGFSAFVSLGSMMDVGWGDLIDYLGRDRNTESIIIYMESIVDARAFLSAAREVSLTKPIIVIKAGRTDVAAKAAASHTGTLAGSDKVLDAAFRRAGVLRVNSIQNLFSMAEVLAKQPLPKGPRLSILTNAGGPGVLATDSAIQAGLELAELAPETIEKLNAFLPTHWSHANPIDVLGDAGPDRYEKALKIIAEDPNTDGLLVILTPQAMSEPTLTASALRSYAAIGKPVLASWMGGAEVAAGNDLLNKANIPTFQYPDGAAVAFQYMWKHQYNLKSLYETPEIPFAEVEEGINRKKAREIIEGVRAKERTLLTEEESKEILKAYGIPVTESLTAKSREEAEAKAQEIGFPVVLKLHSETITHKTDVGGIKLNLANTDAVRKAYDEIEKSVGEKAGKQHFNGVSVQPYIRLEGYELILGSSLDPQFGPVLLFGAGGQLVEVFQDSSLGLPPLNTTLARRMMEQTKIYKALQGVRGRKKIDLSLLEKMMVQFSYLVAEQSWIKEIDINPLLASSEKIVALDARVILHDLDTPAEQLPKVAIRPYPIQYVSSYTIKGGEEMTIRPMRPEDEPMVAKFHETLSEKSVNLRYLEPLKLGERISHKRLIRVCFSDYDREIVLVAVTRNSQPADARKIAGIARLSKISGTEDGDFRLLISDQYQGKDLGTELLKRLIHVAKEEKISHLGSLILQENKPMQHIAEKLGFLISPADNPLFVRASLTL